MVLIIYNIDIKKPFKHVIVADLDVEVVFNWNVVAHTLFALHLFCEF